MLKIHVAILGGEVKMTKSITFSLYELYHASCQKANDQIERKSIRFYHFLRTIRTKKGGFMCAKTVFNL